MRKPPLLVCTALTVVVATALALSAAASAETYRAGQSYQGGSIVEFEGQRYRAKWYANGDQSPAALASAAHAWDTPWERVDAPASQPTPPASRAPTPTATAAGDSYDPGRAYPAACVVAYGGERYRSKWYANPGQSPAEVATAANPWDTPWERVDASVALGCADGSGPGTEPNPGTQPPGEHRIARSQLQAREAQLTDSPLMREVKRSIRTLANAEVEQVQAGRAANPENVRRVESILDAQRFEHVFATRNAAYTYRGFLQAIAKFPAICARYDDGRDSEAICRKTLATMIAHFGQETGGHDASSPIAEWRQALVHVREMGWSESMRNGYNGECNPATWQGQAWPCGKFADGQFKSYFGRGAKQLSYNYNYGPFSEAMFGDVRVLLDRPELVADTWLNFASATFFFSYPQPPKPSMLHVIDGTWTPNARDIGNGLTSGFGVTTQIINGGVECGGSGEVQQSLNRIAYYRQAAAYLEVPVPGNETLGCKGMKQFDEQGAGALPIYWERDDSWVAANPGGLSYACKLVGYQTAHTAFRGGDYERCVTANFKNVVVTAD